MHLFKKLFVAFSTLINATVFSCDTGFGREAAVKLARLGVRVYAGCLTDEVLAQAAWL